MRLLPGLRGKPGALCQPRFRPWAWWDPFRVRLISAVRLPVGVAHS